MAAVVLVASVFIPAAADESASQAPPGSAAHTFHLESQQLQLTRDRLEAAHAALLQALDAETDDPSPLARPVARLHATWLDHLQADCDLVGVFTGAGGSWPGVHALTCRRERLAGRVGIVNVASACLNDLPTDAVPFEQHECLQPLLDPSTSDQ